MSSVVFKGQSAIEYLMTYGWMLMVVAVAGGALFTLVQDQGIQSATGFNSDMTMDDYGFSNNQLQTVFLNVGSNTAQINQVNVSQDGVGSAIFPGYGQAGTQDSLQVSLPGFESAPRSEVDMTLDYDYGVLSSMGSSGTFTGSFRLDESLIGYWTLAGNGSEAIDSSIYGNNGIIGGDPTQGVEGRYGRAYDMQGSSHINSTNDDFDLTQELTLAAWINPEHAGDGDNDEIVAKSDCTYGMDMLDDSGEIRFRLRDGPTGCDYAVSSGWNFDFHLSDTDKWSHVAMTFDREDDVARAYIDGEIEDSRDTTSSLGVSSTPLMIGAQVDDGGDGDVRRFWGGSIQDVMIFDRALTPEEVSSLANSGYYID